MIFYIYYLIHRLRGVWYQVPPDDAEEQSSRFNGHSIINLPDKNYPAAKVR